MDADRVYLFSKYVANLKKVVRTGWVNVGVDDPESVAEHSYGVAVLAMILAPKFNLDVNKIIKMALVHDLAETVTGDIVVSHGKDVLLDKHAKNQAELEVFKTLFDLIEGKEYTQLFEELEDSVSRESRFIKAIDKIEMGVQAILYERDLGINLDPFFINISNYLEGTEFEELLQYVLPYRYK